MSELLKLSDSEIKELSALSANLRKNIVSMIHKAQSGHPGGSLSVIDILTVLYKKHLNHYPDWTCNPNWADRDRFVLSKGHASASLYCILAEMGYFDGSEINTFRCTNTRLQGHPCCNCLPGVEVPTGSLGQGLSMANGIALALKLDKKNSRVYTVLGDGELQEGQVWEAVMAASHYKLGNVTAIVDRNRYQIDGNTEDIMALEPLAKKWEGFGWQVLEIDGHNYQEIYQALQKAKIMGEEKSIPVVIIANTIKGKGVSFMENTAAWHGKAPGDQEYNAAIEELRG